MWIDKKAANASFTITACSSNLLTMIELDKRETRIVYYGPVALQVLRHFVVYYLTYVAFVDSHPESYGAYHYLLPVRRAFVHEPFLNFIPRLRFHPCMINSDLCLITKLGVECFTDVHCIFLSGGINNRVAAFIQYLKQLLQLFIFSRCCVGS